MNKTKNKSFNVQVKLDALISFGIEAPSLEEAIVKARENLRTEGLFADGVEYIDGEETVTGVYE